MKDFKVEIWDIETDELITQYYGNNQTENDIIELNKKFHPTDNIQILIYDFD